MKIRLSNIYPNDTKAAKALKTKVNSMLQCEIVWHMHDPDNVSNEVSFDLGEIICQAIKTYVEEDKKHGQK